MGWVGFTPGELQTAITAGGGPWSPGVPLPPTTPLGSPPVGWAPPVGYNLTYSPDKRQGVRHEQLRNLADACGPIRVVIEDLKRQLRGRKWDVLPIDENVTDHPRLEEVRRLLRKPDGETHFGDWLGAALEDTLVIGAPALGKLRTVQGRAAGLRVVDASTIVPIVTSLGTAPAPPFPAYYQYVHGQPYREYRRDELVYRPFVRRSWTPYGFGPVEQTLHLVLLAVNRALYYVRWYTDGNLPPAFVTLPKEWDDKKLAEMQEYLDLLMVGNTAQKHKAIVVPDGTEVTPGRTELAWDYEFDEFIVRVFSWAAGVSPVYVIKNNSLNQGAEGLSQASEVSGIDAYARFFEEILDEYIAEDLGAPELGFSWLDDRPEGDEIHLRRDETDLRTGVRTVNQVRKDRGYEPYDSELYPEADEPRVLTPGGYVPLGGKATPAALPAGAAQPGAEAGEEPAPEGEDDDQDEDEADAIKAELARWRRKAARDAKAGRRPRPFVSQVLPEWVRHRVEAGLAEGDVAKAFAGVRPHRGPSAARSAAAADVIRDGEELWRRLLKRMVAHYQQEAERVVRDAAEE